MKWYLKPNRNQLVLSWGNQNFVAFQNIPYEMEYYNRIDLMDNKWLVYKDFPRIIDSDNFITEKEYHDMKFNNKLDNELK